MSEFEMDDYDIMNFWEEDNRTVYFYKCDAQMVTEETQKVALPDKKSMILMRIDIGQSQYSDGIKLLSLQADKLAADLVTNYPHIKVHIPHKPVWPYISVLVIESLGDNHKLSGNDPFDTRIEMQSSADVTVCLGRSGAGSLEDLSVRWMTTFSKSGKDVTLFLKVVDCHNYVS